MKKASGAWRQSCSHPLLVLKNQANCIPRNFINFTHIGYGNRATLYMDVPCAVVRRGGGERGGEQGPCKLLNMIRSYRTNQFRKLLQNTLILLKRDIQLTILIYSTICVMCLVSEELKYSETFYQISATTSAASKLNFCLNYLGLEILITYY